MNSTEVTHWQVRKVSNLLAPNWVVHDPDGNWVGKFHSHKEAIDKVNEYTGIGDVVERWLKDQSA